MTMKRIILHWSAGGYTVSDVDREHYHFIVDGKGVVVPGDHRVEDNLSTSDGIYAAHTRGANAGAIGIAVAAMMGAKGPKSVGRYPITAAQWTGFMGLLQTLKDKYGIPVTPQTVLSHAEVQQTLGIRQNGKIDISFGVPGKPELQTAMAVGNYVRGLLK